jgi:hypothetical protein
MRRVIFIFFSKPVSFHEKNQLEDFEEKRRSLGCLLLRERERGDKARREREGKAPHTNPKRRRRREIPAKGKSALLFFSFLLPLSSPYQLV